MKNIAIFGAGGFGREVKMLIDQINESQQIWKFVGYFSDDFSNTTVDGDLQLGGMEELNQYPDELSIVIAIGSPTVKRKIVSRINNSNINFPSLIHPGVLKGASNVTIGDGCIICAGNILTVDLQLGDHIILNLACTVGHDTIIEDFCSFMPGVNISGEVAIRKAVYVGTGAKIINQLEIGENTIVGAGAVVSKTLPENCTAVGIPAKPIKFHDPLS